MSKYLFYFIFLLILLLSYGCGDSSGNEESQSLPTSNTNSDDEETTTPFTQVGSLENGRSDGALFFYNSKFYKQEALPLMRFLLNQVLILQIVQDYP